MEETRSQLLGEQVTFLLSSKKVFLLIYNNYLKFQEQDILVVLTILEEETTYMSMQIMTGLRISDTYLY